MTVPLMILATCAIFAGYLGVGPSMARFVGLHGDTNRFEHFLAPVFDNGTEKPETSVAESGAPAEEKREEGSPSEYLLMALSIAAAGAGWCIAKRAYSVEGKQVPEPIDERRMPPLYRTLLNKYYVDELYDKLFTGREHSRRRAAWSYRSRRRTLEVRLRGD